MVGISYYILNIQNNQRNQELALEARKIHLTREAIGKTASRDFLNDLTKVLYQQWENYDDFIEKYGPYSNPDAYAAVIHVCEEYHIMGLDMRHGIIDADYVYERGFEVNLSMWNKVKPIVYGIREASPLGLQYSSLWDGFDYLALEMERIHHERNPHEAT